MVICAVLGCGNRSNRDKDKRFFRLPSVLTNQGTHCESLSNRRQGLWLARIREGVSPEQYYNVRVCSDHFLSGAPSKLYDTDNPDWAPCLKLGYEVFEGRSLKATTERHERLMERRWIQMKAMLTDNEHTSAEIDGSGETDELSTHPSIAIQTDSSFGVVDMNGELKKENMELKRENADLKENVAALKETNAQLHSSLRDTSMNEDSFKDNDKKVVFYTGLSTWCLLMVLFEYVKPFLHVGGNGTLSPFQQLIITLIRLCLNLSIQDLAFRFNVHNSTISRVFNRVIDVLYCKLKPLIKWPDRDELKKTMPMAFRKSFPSCVVIIDCFEIFLDRPTSLLARAQTYSAYKHHNTVKYLIGITPQGTVSFISDGWGGRTSDKYITEHSTFLDHLVPGDTVLADRGFDIKDSVGVMMSKLELPAFTKNQTQLDPISIEQTRNIANVRIHVERVIGNMIRDHLEMLQ